MPDVAYTVVQISDCHLQDDPHSLSRGVDNDATLDAVLRLIEHRERHVSLLLGTGDLTQDGSEAAYLRLQQQLQACGLNYRLLPGNHDSMAAMQSVLDDGVLERVIERGGWRILLLDSTVANCEGGHLAESEIEWLLRQLEHQRDKPVLVAMHHQPIPVGSEWIDAIGTDNGEHLLELLARHPQVKGVIFGHVHQEFDHSYQHIRVMGTPSTSVQFKPEAKAFTLDDREPGYRWLKLYPDGALESGVERTDGVLAKMIVQN